MGHAEEHDPEKLKLISRSEALRFQSTGKVEEQDKSDGHSEPPATGQVPTALRRSQTPSPAEEDSPRKLELLTVPSPGYMPIPLDRPLPWKEAFACVKNAIENGRTLNAVSFSTLILACANAGRVDEALRAFALMQEERVEPNAYTFDILISACENKGLFEKVDELLDNAVQRHVYQGTLGYDKEANELDFHRKKILTGEPGGGGVSVPFARALFRRHRAREAGFGPGTLLIVGRHGEGLVKDAILKCIETEQGTARYQRKDGYVNYGAMHWTTPRQQPEQSDIAPASNTPSRPGLNPNAREFVPSWASSNPPVSLNPNAQVFVPSGLSLNPNADEFVPGQKPQ